MHAKNLWIIALMLGAAAGCTSGKDDLTDRDGDGRPDSEDCAPDDLFAGEPTTFYADGDHDGYGDPAATEAACTQPSGYVADDTDCDDTDPGTHPGAAEVWYDGLDEDCDGADDNDQDGDGFPLAEDCDDTNPLLYPSGGAETTWYDGVDSNCDGNDGDQDGDGWYAADYAYDVPAGYADHTGDCYDDPRDSASWRALNGLPDPLPADVYPGAPEAWYDGLDEDCAGGDDFDADGDGYAASGVPDASGHAGTDCDDTNPGVNPGALDSYYDGVDSNCSGNNDYDADGDGYGTDGSGRGADCDDEDPAVHPDATESCNTPVDDDCDGSLDANNAAGCTEWHADTDADGYGGARGICRCAGTGTYTLSDGSDCVDTDPAIHPGATETCNGTDDDCDGRRDEDLADCTYTPDTGIAELYLGGEVVTDSSGFVSGNYGLDLLRIGSYPSIDSVCSLLGPTTATAMRTSCTGCDWSFSFTVSGSVASGDHCADFGITDGLMDGTTGGWGWADSYVYSSSSYGPYTFTDTVFYYFASYRAWYPITFEFDGNYYGGIVSGDHTDSLWRTSLSYYYYFYN